MIDTGENPKYHTKDTVRKKKNARKEEEKGKEERRGHQLRPCHGRNPQVQCKPEHQGSTREKSKPCGRKWSTRVFIYFLCPYYNVYKLCSFYKVYKDFQRTIKPNKFKEN